MHYKMRWLYVPAVCAVAVAVSLCTHGVRSLLLSHASEV